MFLSFHDVSKYWVEPALEFLKSTHTGAKFNAASVQSNQLVSATGYLESRYQALEQYGGGPAVGFWQMEPATFSDNVKWAVENAILDITSKYSPERMASEPVFGALMCRIHYLRKPFSMPTSLTSYQIAGIHKKYYNTILGKADQNSNAKLVQEFLKIN